MLKSAFSWTEDARGDDELLSMLRTSAVGKRPSSSSIPDWPVQRWNLCAQVGGDNRLSFADFWSFAADNQNRNLIVASAVLSGDLERLKDIFESDDCSIFFNIPI